MYCTALQCNVLHYNVLYCIIMYCNVLQCNVLHCTCRTLFTWERGGGLGGRSATRESSMTFPPVYSTRSTPLIVELNMSPMAESKLAVENGDVSTASSWLKDFRLQERN